MMKKIKKPYLILIAVAVIGVSFFAGVGIGVKKEQQIASVKNLPINTKVGEPASVDFSTFWNVWNKINEKYVSTDGPSSQKKVYGAISGLVSSLGDPYSVFFPPKESKFFKSEIRGNFEGVGMEIGVRNKMLTVISPLKGTPASLAGILAGDKITKINKVETSGITINDAVDLIRGKSGTPVTFTIERDGVKKPIEIKVIRGTIDIPTIKTESKKDGVFVISLYSFTANSPYLFRDAIRKFVKSGDHKLILDLRNNPGGYMEAAIDMASWFLPAGDVVVKEKSRSKDEKVYRSKGYNIFNKNLKFVILINGGSASASEILAGALSEHGKATLVGEQSFGKGSVQELIPITDNTSLKITIAKWFTPEDISISKNGLTPNVKVALTKKDFETGKDPQMAKAIQILNSK